MFSPVPPAPEPADESPRSPRPPASGAADEFDPGDKLENAFLQAQDLWKRGLSAPEIQEWLFDHGLDRQTAAEVVEDLQEEEAEPRRKIRSESRDTDPAEMRRLERRLHRLEWRLRQSNLFSESFMTRAFAAWGHTFVAGLLIALPLYLLMFFVAAMLSRR